MTSKAAPCNHAGSSKEVVVISVSKPAPEKKFCEAISSILVKNKSLWCKPSPTMITFFRIEGINNISNPVS